jgi:hypothetical protein
MAISNSDRSSIKGALINVGRCMNLGADLTVSETTTHFPPEGCPDFLAFSDVDTAMSCTSIEAYE